MKHQRNYLTGAQHSLGVGPVEMAKLLKTPFNTYKAWLYEKNPIPGVALVAIDSLIKLEQAND